jgi:heme/copper-type cytochrome/quinol oxidase subunit 4
VTLGLIVIIVLAALTGIEYVIAKEIEENLIPLILMAQVKAALILWYFMHIQRVRASEGEH